MSDIDTGKAKDSNLDTRSQTLTHKGKTYRYAIQDIEGIRGFAHRAKLAEASGKKIPKPEIKWLGVTDELLIAELNDAWANAVAYRGLKSQAQDMLDQYRRKK